MAKINWEKVEQLLHKGLEEYDIRDFQEAVTRAIQEAGSGLKQQTSYTTMMPALTTVGFLISGTQHDLRSLEKKNPKLFESLAAERKELDELEDRLAKFVQEDWTVFRDLKTKIQTAIMGSVSGGDEKRNEKLIEKNLLQLRKTGKYYFKESGRKNWRTV